MFLTKSQITSSSGVIPFEASYKNNTKSASSKDCFEYSIPISSTLETDSSSLIPAVSIKVTGIPKSKVSLRTSLVVPAISVTIALSRFKRVLNSDDLPTFGRPTIATETPCRIIFDVEADFRIVSIEEMLLEISSDKYEYSGSATSSGKSIPATILDNTSIIDFLIVFIFSAKTPERFFAEIETKS